MTKDSFQKRDTILLNLNISWVSAFELSNNKMAMMYVGQIAAYSWTRSPGRLAWSEGRRPSGAGLRTSDEPSELSKWLSHDDSTINIVICIIIIMISISGYSVPEHTGTAFRGPCNCSRAFLGPHCWNLCRNNVLCQQERSSETANPGYLLYTRARAHVTTACMWRSRIILPLFMFTGSIWLWLWMWTY